MKDSILLYNILIEYNGGNRLRKVNCTNCGHMFDIEPRNIQQIEVFVSSDDVVIENGELFWHGINARNQASLAIGPRYSGTNGMLAYQLGREDNHLYDRKHTEIEAMLVCPRCDHLQVRYTDEQDELFGGWVYIDLQEDNTDRLYIQNIHSLTSLMDACNSSAIHTEGIQIRASPEASLNPALWQAALNSMHLNLHSEELNHIYWGISE